MAEQPIKTYRSLVIGAGRIGAMYDSPGDPMTLSHCHAYANTPRVSLAGIVDTNPEAARTAAARWNTTAYTSLPQALVDARADIISVCTPTRSRREVVTAVAAVRPRFIFLEKPIASNAAEAAAVADMVVRSGAGCMVNYPRLFDPAVIQLAERAVAGEYGPFITGIASYSKGLRNNGSHVISLVQSVAGRIGGVRNFGSTVDFSDDDPSAAALLQLGGGVTFYLIPVDERAYSIIDVTFFFRDVRAHFRNFGLEVCITKPREDPVFPGYRDLESQLSYLPTGLSRSLDVAVGQIVKTLDDGAPFGSDLASALRTEEVVDRITQAETNVHG